MSQMGAFKYVDYNGSALVLTCGDMSLVSNVSTTYCRLFTVTNQFAHICYFTISLYVINNLIIRN